MIKTVLFLAAGLLTIPLLAQEINISSTDKTISKLQLSSFSGKVTDSATGQPLQGATVYFADIKTGTVTDAGGHFMFSDIPTGHHLIEISYVGYISIIEHIDITTSTEKNYALQPSVVENRTVIVTGVTNATSIRKTPVPVTSVRKAELMQTASANIIDALAKKPGVSQSGTGPGISKPVIRGLGYNRVVVINEGIRQEGQQWGDEHGIEIDELSVNRAEILKGPASLIYGSDALAGVINLITNVPVAEGTVKGNLLTNFQSNNDLFGLNGNVAGNKKGINWNLYGTLKKTGDYENRYDGKVLNSRYNEKNFGGYFGVNKKWGFSHLIFSSFNQNVGLVKGDRDGATGRFILYAGSSMEQIATNEDLNERDPFIPRQNIKHYKISSDNSFALNKHRLKVNIGYQNNLRKEYGNPEDEDETELYFDLKTVNYNVQLVLPEKKEWHTTVGVNGMYQTNMNKGEEAIIPDYSLFDAGVFVFSQRYFKKGTLSGGIRFDHRSIDSKAMMEGNDVKFEAFEKSFNNVSASVGYSYEPSEQITLKANLARGFRAPNMAELGSNGAHEGTNRYEYGDKNLSSETSLQFDGGFQVEYEHFSFGLSSFYNRINDFIFYRKLEAAGGGDSLVNVDGEDLMAFQFDQFDAQLSGFELSLDIHPHPLDWLHFENTVSIVRGRFTEKISGTDNLPLIPAPRILSELRANFKKSGKALRNFYFKVEMDHNFRQNKPFFAFDTETATTACTLLNAGIGTDFVNKKGNTIFNIHFAGLNLTDAAYQNHLSRLKYTDKNMVTGRTGVFNMGGNFSLKLNIPLNFQPK